MLKLILLQNLFTGIK